MKSIVSLFPLDAEKNGRLANSTPRRNLSRMPVRKAKKQSVKATAMKLISDLPATATWEDLMYQLHVRQKIDAGLKDLRAGRTVSHSAIRKEFGVS